MDVLLNELTELPTIFALVFLACSIVVMIRPHWLVRSGSQGRQPSARNLWIVRICMIPGTAFVCAMFVVMSV